MAAKVMAETGAAFVHPYDDDRIIAGQGTAAMELMEDQPDLDFILAPIGGGGLMGGTALAAAYFSPTTKAIACEPDGADDAFRWFRAIMLIVQPKSQDARRWLAHLRRRTQPGNSVQYVDQVITCSEEAMVQAMRLVWNA